MSEQTNQLSKTTVCNKINTTFWDCYRNNNYSIKPCHKIYYQLTKCINNVKTNN